MSHTPAESLTYLDECRFAFEKLYEAVGQYRQEKGDVAERLDELKQAAQLADDLFMFRDQWSPHANHFHARYMENRDRLEAEKKRLMAGEDARIGELLTRLDATEESLAALAGSILQVSKQVLGFRFGPKPNLPGARRIGTQSIVEVVWEGRNHAMHWDEGAPRAPVRTMLETLRNDTGLPIAIGVNNSLTLLAALDWNDAGGAVNDLRALVR